MMTPSAIRVRRILLLPSLLYYGRINGRTKEDHNQSYASQRCDDQIEESLSVGSFLGLLLGQLKRFPSSVRRRGVVFDLRLIELLRVLLKSTRYRRGCSW